MLNTARYITKWLLCLRKLKCCCETHNIYSQAVVCCYVFCRFFPALSHLFLNISQISSWKRSRNHLLHWGVNEQRWDWLAWTINMRTKILWPKSNAQTTFPLPEQIDMPVLLLLHNIDLIFCLSSSIPNLSNSLNYFSYIWGLAWYKSYLWRTFYFNLYIF